MSDELYSKKIEELNLTRKKEILKKADINDRKRSLAGDMLVKKYLSKLYGTPEEKIEIKKGAHGKPYVLNLPAHFNISHSGDYTVVAIGDRPIGIDIEIIKDFSAILAKKLFNEDELKYIIDEIEEQGVLEEQESDLVKSALEFDEITVNEILIPRIKVVGVEKNASIEEIKNLFIEEMYSRIPVYEKSLDNIIGMITNKRFFKMLSQGGDDISEIIQDVAHFSDLKLISEALRDMQRLKTHLAVVLDQYGGTKGIITLEDIIEELVGEIYDENDEIVPHLIKISDNEFEVTGDLSISDMLEEIGLDENLIESTYTSVGGWVTELLEHIPENNETAQYGNFFITVLKVKEQSVEKLNIRISSSEAEK